MKSAACKSLIKLIQESTGRRHVYDVFRDFVDASACAIANAVDPVGHDEREDEYEQIRRRYEPDEFERFPQMLAALVEAIEVERGDVLGYVFSELELHNKSAGQFFTPDGLCKVMAKLTIKPDEARAAIDQRGFVTVMEPACGAGAMVIALAEHLREGGINYQRHLHVTCIDLDARAAHMAYVQLALLHVPAIVHVGNTLSLDIRQTLRTPAHVMGMWDNKLARGYALGSAMDDSHNAVTTPAPVACRGQMELFGAIA